MLSSNAKKREVLVESHVFSDDGRFINSPYPALVYRNAVASSGPRASSDLALAFEQLFAEHDWPPAWRAGLYTVHHYHGAAHEVLGIFSGWVKARLGGEGGALVTLHAGDAVLIPAGVAHRNEGQSPDFCAVGAYPKGMRVDMRYGRDEERRVDERRLAGLPAPMPDPVLGSVSKR